MARVYKVLGQAAPAATTDTDLYTVPVDTQAVISTLTVANRGNTDLTYRIAVRPGGDSLSDEHYIAYDTTVLANDTIAITIGLSLDEEDVLSVYSSSASASFGAFGTEVTP